MSEESYIVTNTTHHSDKEWLMVQNHAKLMSILKEENAALKAEMKRLQEGINDLRMYNGDQEEMSNIFARLK